jgi:hypothetical protein
MKRDPVAPVLVPSPLRLVEPMRHRLLAGLVLGPIVAAFLGRPLAWLSIPLAVALAFTLLSRGGRVGPAVRVDRGGVWHADLLVLPRSAIDFASVHRRLQRTVLRLYRGSDVVGELAVRDAGEAQRVLDALGVTSRDKVLRVATFVPRRLAIPLAALAVLVAVPAFVIGLASEAVLLAVAAGAALVLVPPILLAHDVRVGADGALVSSAWSTRFVGYAEIAGVAETAATVVLYLEDGDETLVIRPPPLVRSALAQSIRDALAAFRAVAPPEATAGITQGGSSGASAREGSFRVAPLPVEALVEVAACPAASAQARTLATQALGEVDDDWAREELERAAEACASPEVRPALRRLTKRADPS